jgi:hypothetical protein
MDMTDNMTHETAFPRPASTGEDIIVAGPSMGAIPVSDSSGQYPCERSGAYTIVTIAVDGAGSYRD